MQATLYIGFLLFSCCNIPVSVCAYSIRSPREVRKHSSTTQIIRFRNQQQSYYKCIHNPIVASVNSRCYSASSSNNEISVVDESDEINKKYSGVRRRLRQITGFSLTAFRKTVKLTSGTSAKITKQTLRLFPLWLRFVFQPFLIAYYWPLVLLRGVAKESSTAIPKTPLYTSSAKLEETKIEPIILPSTDIVPNSVSSATIINEIRDIAEGSEIKRNAEQFIVESSANDITLEKEVQADVSEIIDENDLNGFQETVHEEKVAVRPAGTRWATATPSCDLSGKWNIIVDDIFLKQYDKYLEELGQPAIVRTVACSIVSFTKEEYEQREDGRVLVIKGTNPRGMWTRNIVSSGTIAGESDDFDRVETPVKTADSELVMAEAWWENDGTVHKSWMRGGKKWGGGDFESTRYLDGNTLVCESIFHPTDESRPKSCITWRFKRG